MDNTQYGITEYVGEKDLSEIPCIIKLMYSDFIVTEINDKKEVLTPESFEDEENREENKVEIKSECIQADEPEIKRPKLISEEDEANIKDVAEGRAEFHKVHTENVEKEERRLAHEYIRKRFGSSLVSNGEQNAIVIKRIDKRNPDSRARREPWPESRGDYLHFVLTKENQDHMHALSIVSKLCGLKPKFFTVAGTKDRRAITSQIVCVYRVPEERFLSISSRLRQIWLSNFSYSPRRIQLGDLWGNRFSIVLRDIGSVSEDEMKKRIEQWTTIGFLNYFGHQRFGACGVSTADVGQLILSGKWEEAVRKILTPRVESRGPLADCLKCFHETNDAALALQKLTGALKYTQIEAIILGALKNKKNAYKDAIMALHRDSRSLYVHAYQSLIFNKILSRRMQEFGTRVLSGDLMSDNQLKVKSEEGFNLDHVVLPLPSSNPNLPDNEVGPWYKEMLNADALSPNSFAHLEGQFALGDVCRPIIVKPTNVNWEILEYENPRQILQFSPFVSAKSEPTQKLLPKTEDEPDKKTVEISEQNTENAPVEANKSGKKYRALKIQFDLPSSCYATIALRELLRCDFSKTAQKQIQNCS